MSRERALVTAAWAIALAAAVAVRGWNALTGPLLWGYDGWGHVAYVLFLDVYRALPWGDQGWSYFHPPLHYLFGWALAQLGSAESLLRGLAILGSAASLGVAGLTAWVTRAIHPHRPGLALLAFLAVAFLPVHLYTSPMPGNEQTATFWMSAALALLVVAPRPRRSLARDAAVGALVGLALLTKFTGALVLVTAVGVGLGEILAARRNRSGLGRACLGSIVLGGVALTLAAPYYQRNLREFGTPFFMSRERPLVAQAERRQPPGQRTWRDFVSVSPRLLTDPDPLAPHLVQSVWGSLYLNTWADSQRLSMFFPTQVDTPRVHRFSSLLASVGLVPSGLALAGALLAGGDLLRGRRRRAYGTLALLTVTSLGVFVAFALRVPHWSALKASYLLVLAIPYGVFLARAVEALSRWRGATTCAAAGIVAAAGTAAVVFTSGAVFRLIDSEAVGGAYYYFGNYEAARRPYEKRISLVGPERAPLRWVEGLAAVELADGHPSRARRLYAIALRRDARDPFRFGRAAVAAALDGDLAAAHELLDQGIARTPAPELLANRGAVRAARGDWRQAEEDLRRAVQLDPGLPLAWGHLARVLAAQGSQEEAEAAAQRAYRESSRAPRGYPHAVGTGAVPELLIGQRLLLRFDAEGHLELARPGDFARRPPPPNQPEGASQGSPGRPGLSQTSP